jgi:hypothetical protein
MKKYIFPENNWYIEITDDNKKIVNDWKIQQEWKQDLYTVEKKYVDFNGNSGIEITNRRSKLTQITTDEFIQYVLKEYVFPKNWAIKQNACQEACDWFNDINKSKNNFAYLEGAHKYLTFEAKYSDDLSNYIEITAKQFIKYVLKQTNNHFKLINILKFIDKWKQ